MGIYICLSIILKTAISKKFKKRILDYFSLTDYLYLLAVDKIHLVKDWGKNFCLIYAKIEKI